MMAYDGRPDTADRYSLKEGRRGREEGRGKGEGRAVGTLPLETKLQQTSTEKSKSHCMFMIRKHRKFIPLK